MSVINIVIGKIEVSRLELETNIKSKTDEIKYNHTQNINFLDIKVSSITSINTSTYSTPISTNQNIW